MNKDNLLKLMDNVPFFKEMDNDEREGLLAYEKHWMQFKPQEKILKEDEVDYGFFVLLEGKVSVLRSKPTEMTLAQLVGLKRAKRVSQVKIYRGATPQVLSFESRSDSPADVRFGRLIRTPITSEVQLKAEPSETDTTETTSTTALPEVN